MKSIELIKLLKSIDRVDKATVDEYILETFPEKPFMAGKKNVFRAFTPFLFQTIDKKHIDQALKLCDTIYKRLYTKTSTLDSIFTKDVRSVIKERFGEKSREYKLSKKLLKITYEEKSELIRQGKEKVLDNNNNRIEISTEDIFKIIKESIVSDDPMRQMLVLLIASGSRPTELFERSTFQPYNYNDTDYWITQKYVAKSKTKDELIKPLIYFKNDQFIELLTRAKTELRKKYPSFVNSKNELSSTIMSNLNKAAKEVFEYQDKVTPYTARKIYGNLAFELYGSKTPFGKNLSVSTFLNNVLGHNKSSLETSHNYSNVDVKSKKITPTDLALKTEILEQKVDELEEIIEQEGCNKKCESVESVVGIKKNEKLEKQLKKVDEACKKNKVESKKLTQTLLEKLLTGIVPRTVVRLYYSQID